MAISIVMPRLGDFMTEGTINAWTKAPGDEVKQGEIIAEIETEKINYDLEATDNGILHPTVNAGSTIPVDGLLGYLLAVDETPPKSDTQQPKSSESTPAVEPKPKPIQAKSTGDIIPSTPAARKLATKLNIDIAKVTPTGPRGRIVESDVRQYVEEAVTPSPSFTETGLPTPSKILPLQGIRKSIADHMRFSISNTAQLTFFIEVDTTEIRKLRTKESRGSDQTVTTPHVMIKACSEALKREPMLNTILSNANILQFTEINIGMAVALKEGLIVPVIRNVESKDIHQISKETTNLINNARDGKLSTDEVVGATFTISVLGSVDGFTPILSKGQSAILGVGRSVEKPVASSGKIIIREMMNLSLTVDHQVIDGAIAASFLRRLQQLIERPTSLFRQQPST